MVPPQRTDTQPPAAKHTCTNAKVCKRLIIEETEKPQWQLTCYSHYGYGPCDIVGDISFEELRALAYDNAKQGKSLQFIVERERSLLNSKLNEFQNLVQKPYTVPSAPTPGSQDLFAGGSANTPVVNNGFSSQASGFGQLSGLLNTGYAAAPNYTFGELSAFQNNSQPSSSSLLHMNNSPFNSSGVYGNQLPQQSISTPSSFSFGSSNFGKIAVSAPGNTSSTLANTSQTWNASDKPFDTVTNAVELVSNSPKNTVVDDNALAAQWKWNAGEIPEDALPDIHID